MIQLDENRSTGYSWTILENNCLDRAKLTSDLYSQKSTRSRMVGQSGIRTLVFTT